MNDNSVVFQEVQRFRNPILWAVFTCSFLLVLGLCGYAFLKPLSQIPWGEMLTTTKITVIVAGLAIVFFSGMLGVLLQAKLITQVRKDGLYIHWIPLQYTMRQIPLENVERIEPITYRPIKEYRGWGIRNGRGGKAYSIDGDRGVKIHYQDGSHILIGSQKPEKLVEGIEALMKQA